LLFLFAVFGRDLVDRAKTLLIFLKTAMKTLCWERGMPLTKTAILAFEDYFALSAKRTPGKMMLHNSGNRHHSSIHNELVTMPVVR
jgi:hypothetical protein